MAKDVLCLLWAVVHEEWASATALWLLCQAVVEHSTGELLAS